MTIGSFASASAGHRRTLALPASVEGQPYTVRYEAVNAMLLNEFLKEHRKVEEQQATVRELRATVETLVSTVKDQATQIKKVSDELATSKPARRLVNND